ncbi:MAG: nondiscriminating aspartyl-tRNA synthetase [Bacillota bacterium]|nr:MAG: nondiscriminating aspartyl-tRNA synthetase [Bacillota bacterium]
MIKRTLSNELLGSLGQAVTLQGWVRRIREVSAGLVFLIVADRGGETQVVLSGSLTTQLPTVESVVEITGVVQTSRSRVFPHELAANQLTVLSQAEPLPFPINQAELGVGLDIMDKFRPLALRHPLYQDVFRVQHRLLAHFAEFFSQQGFTRVSTPKMVATGTEGGAELFKIDYFGETAYLAQSPQFFKQMLVGAGFERVFEMGPVFRAEAHHTSRHLNEFISLDIEMGFVEDVNVLMDLEESFLRSLLQDLHERFSTITIAPELPTIPRLPLGEALGIIHREHGKVSEDGNIDPEGERLICQWAEREHGVPAAFLHSYPRHIRPFYALPGVKNAGLTESFDLIFRGQEITTGGLRQHQLNLLLDSMRERGLTPEKYEFYLQVFRYGMPPHGGFAIGAERLTMQLLGLKNIREASVLPLM